MKTIDDSVLSRVNGGLSTLSPEMQRRVNTWLESLRNIPNLRGTAPKSEPYGQPRKLTKP